MKIKYTEISIDITRGGNIPLHNQSVSVDASLKKDGKHSETFPSTGCARKGDEKTTTIVGMLYN